MDVIRELTAADKEAVTQRVLEVYQGDPARLKSALPEVADLLSGLVGAATALRGDESSFGLTERERNFHTEALDGLLRRSSSLTQAEAVAGLEHAASLLVDGFTPGYPPRQVLLRLVRKATGIQPRKTGRPVEAVLAEEESSRTVPVVRGVDLHLTWDFKLVRVTMDPDQWRLRARALSIVGMGTDTATDVAERHDDYLADALQNGYEQRPD